MTIGRPLEFIPEEALEAAMHLFWQKGYESASLQDLLNVMGLSKSSFYQTFGSKHKLLEQCIGHYRQILANNMLDRVEKLKSGRAFIEECFYAVAKEVDDTNQPRGCLLMNCASEFSQRDQTIAKLVKQGTRELTTLFLSSLKRAQNEGEISSDKDTRALAIYFVSSMSGIKTMAKAGTDKKTLTQIASVILSTLD